MPWYIAILMRKPKVLRVEFFAGLEINLGFIWGKIHDGEEGFDALIALTQRIKKLQRLVDQNWF